MKLNEFFELSYFINLKKRKDRLAKVTKEFDKLDFRPDRFEAIENANPVVGCLYSHLAILKRAANLHKNVLIFEDDVEFVGAYKETIECALDELSHMEWNMGFLGGNVLSPIYQVTDHLGRLTHCQSTHSYFVNANFLETLIAKVEAFDNHIDVMYAWGIVPHNLCYITIPMVAIQSPSYSDILQGNSNYFIPQARYEHFLVRKNDN